MLFAVHAIDKKDILPTRAKFYRAHRVHLDEAQKHDVDAWKSRAQCGRHAREGVDRRAVPGVDDEVNSILSSQVIVDDRAWFGVVDWLVDLDKGALI
jgi:hypothetical protein